MARVSHVAELCAGLGVGRARAPVDTYDNGVRHVWKTRVFAPAAEVAEDPATGSAAGPLALHLARHGFIPFGQRIRIAQGAEVKRPSVLSACAHGTGERVEGVEVGGGAVIVARGEFRLP